MRNQLHNPFKPGDFVALDRPAKAVFLRAPDGRLKFTEMFWRELPIRGWHEIAGVSRQVTASGLEAMIAVGLVEQFGAEEGDDEESGEWPASRASLGVNNPMDPRCLRLLGGATSHQIQIDISETNHGTWGARLTIDGFEVYNPDAHKKQGLVLYKVAGEARALAADLRRFAELVEEDAARRNTKQK